MKKTYEAKENDVIKSVKNFINFIQEDPNVECDTTCNIYYKDKKKAKRKINIRIKKEIIFDGKEFFNKYETTVKTYIENKKIGDHYVKYMIYKNESNGKHKDIQEDRVYNIDYIYYKINEFVEYQQEG